MLEMETRSFLVGARESKQFRLAVQFSKKGQAVGVPGPPAFWKSLGSSEGYWGASLPRKPFGKITAGWPVRFVITNCWPLVGATITSKSPNTLATASIAILRARAAWIYSTAGMNRAVRNVF